MSLLVPVYRPEDAPPGALVELPGHFDALPAPPGTAYVLRAETGETPRSFTAAPLKNLKVLGGHHRGGLPRLWVNQAWARESYIHFHRLTREAETPRLLVLSPPLVSDCPVLEEFLALYRPFEDELARRRPGVWLHLENRPGRAGADQPLVARHQDLAALARAIDKHGLTLRLSLNLPALFATHLGGARPTARDVEEILTPLRHCAFAVGALRPFADPVAFFQSEELSRAALTRLRDILNDSRHRHLLPAEDGPEPAPGLKALRQAGFSPAP